MVLMLAAAIAAAYDCPQVNVPSDAKDLYPGDVEGLYTAVEQWSGSFWDSSCIADCTEMGDFSVCKEADCVTPEGVAFSYSQTELEETETTTSALVVELLAPDGADYEWTYFYFRKVITNTEDYTTGDTRLTTRWESSWIGTLPDLPTNFSAVGTIEGRAVFGTGSTGESIEFDEDGGCYWRWTHDVYEGEEKTFYEAFEEWSLQTFATDNFTVEHLFGGCDEAYGGTFVATLNGDYIGQVDGATWDFVGKDEDGDGWSVEGGDPDDANSWLVACTQIEEEEQEEVIDYDDKLCGMVVPAGMAPLGLVLLAIRRRRSGQDLSGA